MAVSTNYLNDLIGLARAASEAEKARIDAEVKRAAGGTFSTDATGKTTYAESKWLGDDEDP